MVWVHPRQAKNLFSGASNLRTCFNNSWQRYGGWVVLANLLNGSGSIFKKSFHPSEPTADNTGNPHWNISQILKVVIPILQSSYPKFWKKNRPSQKGFGKILGIPIFPRKTHRVTTAPDSFLPVRCAGLHRQKHRLPSSSSPPWGSLWIPQAVGGLMVCWWWFLHGQFIKEA